MHYVIILGSNQGDKNALIDSALHILSQKVGKLIKQSHKYETAPWGFESQQNFYNQVAIFKSELSPRDFLNCSLETEKELGRIRSSSEDSRYTDRPIDIDILFCDDLVYKDAQLEIPHPRIHQRRFVLVPLVEIIPEYIHPCLLKSMLVLLSECQDSMAVDLV